ncbi:hypothetical protein ACR2R6_02210 [Methylocaldum gracile subsp. desertum]|uniref:hypothetical protein n=1 Tax=Methylocaldum sp. GT1BW TaxID=3438964 RepID=UPI003DA155E6
MIEENGELYGGLEWGGKVHKAFTLRPIKVIDTVTATEKCGEKRNLDFELELLACQIVTLGEIPKEAINAELLKQLYDADLGRLQEAREAVEKKLKPRSEDSATSA